MTKFSEKKVLENSEITFSFFFRL